VNKPWKVIAAREIWVKLHDKTFLLSTAFMLVLIVASIVFSAFMGNRAETRTVAVVDPQGAAVVQTAQAIGKAEVNRLTLKTTETSGPDQARALLRDGDADAALLPLTGNQASRWELVAENEVDSGLYELMSRGVSAHEMSANAEAAGTTAQEVLAGTALERRSLDPSAIGEGVRFGLAFAFGFLFYITALVFGMSIAQSVIEEKQSRVVEILAAAVPIRQLLAGKVIGNSLLAIGQVVLLAGVGLIGLSVSGQGEVLSRVLGASAWFIVFFLLGFTALACIWAVAGSVATRQEDLSATTMPIQAIVFVALFVGIAGSGNMLAVGSFVPLVSSVAMPVRMLAEDVPMWQPLLAAVLVLLTAVALILLGARLYEGSLLRTNRRTKLREALSGGE
jgi:ABC-2 type transport system permease protein